MALSSVTVPPATFRPPPKALPPLPDPYQTILSATPLRPASLPLLPTALLPWSVVPPRSVSVPLD